MSVKVRPAGPGDGPTFVSLVRALAEFEKLPGPTDEAAARLVEDALGPRPKFELFMGEVDGEVVGYAATFTTYSTFLAKPTLFLEDLFVHPRARRRGLARQMMIQLRDVAEARGCGRFEWNVLDWNVEAQQFYAGLGAELLQAWRVCRIVL